MTCSVSCQECHRPRAHDALLSGLDTATRITTLLVALMIVLGTVGCGHGRFAWQTENAEHAGEREFAQIMVRKGYRYAAKPALTEPVMRVAGRILDAARASAYAARAQQIRWDVAVIDAPEIRNAFATPGGRIIVFTGLFPVARTEAGLAAVLGHEVTHVLEEHSVKERNLRGRTESLAAVTGAIAGTAVGVATKNADIGIKLAEAVGSSLARSGVMDIVLPYSREQEMEADRLGVELAARAGYDPREASTVLERMGAYTAQPENAQLSTHPALAERRASLRFWSTDALIFYRGNAPGAEESAAGSKRSRRLARRAHLTETIA